MTLNQELESSLFFLTLTLTPFITGWMVEASSKLKEWKGTIVIISTFASFGLITMTAIQEVQAGSLSFEEFYLRMGIFAVIIVGLGYRNRKSVKASFKKTYLTFVTSYTYIFIASAVSMHWISPYMRIPV